MYCNNCGTMMEDHQPYCPKCGERMDGRKRGNGKVKPRRKYNTIVFVVISWFIGGLIIGINDFYAGYNKMGLFRTLGPIAGIAILAGGANMSSPGLAAIGAIPLIASFFIGVWELFMLGDKAYMLENGNAILIRALDVVLDRKGVNQMLMNTYGCGLADRK